MKKYLINIEGHNGDPGGDYHYHFKASEDNLKEKLKEELQENYPPYEDECEEFGGVDEFIQAVVDDKAAYWSDFGYGTFYKLEIEEL